MLLSNSILYCNQLDDPLTPTVTATAAPAKHVRDKPAQLSLASVSDNSIIHGRSSVNSSLPGPLTKSDKCRYRVRYLGCHTCCDPRTNRLDHGISAYQKPLLDLYSTVLRRSVVVRSLYSSLSAVNQIADMSQHGIVIATSQSSHTRPHSSVSASSVSNGSPSTSNTTAATPNETVVTKVITPLSNILLWAAVKFKHRSNVKNVKTNAKRRQIGAFVPLSCSDSVLDKNAFISLNAKQRFLLGLPHPPLFACILQKVNSGQRLECHLFVCVSSEDAIRMCNRMAELRQGSANIGRLHVPLTGQMGPYSYRGTPQQSIHSTTTPSIASRSSNYAFSELSSFATRHHCSDIEEEDLPRSNGASTECAEPNESNSGVKLRAFAAGLNKRMDHHHHHHNHNRQQQPQHSLVNGRPASGQRSLERARRMVALTKHNNNHSTNGNDSLSWTELSSISSMIISTKSEPNKSRTAAAHAAAARRDYRFQSYKSPQNFVLPELSNDSDGNGSHKLVHRDIISANKCPITSPIPNEEKSSKWSNVSDELQNNRLFAKASAKAAASFDTKDTTTTTTTTHPALQLDSNETKQEYTSNNVNKRIPHKQQSILTVPNNENVVPNLAGQRFFGDTLRGVKVVEAIPSTNNNNKSIVNNNIVQRTEGQSTPNTTVKVLETNQSRLTKEKQSAKVTKMIPKTNGDHKQINGKLKSTISNSIFFDNEEHNVSVKEINERHKISAENNNNNNNNDANNRQRIRVSTFASEELLAHVGCGTNQNIIRNQIPKNGLSPKSNHAISKTKSEPNVAILSNNKNRSRDLLKLDPPVVLYLPESSNVGVKCFNKSTSVDKWSTMIASNGSTNSREDCELCSMEVNCEECCNLCQSMESDPTQQQQQQQHLQCPDCMIDHDDIVLDDSILQNFSKSRTNRNDNKNCNESFHHNIRTQRTSNTLSPNLSGNFYQRQRGSIEGMRLDSIISKTDTPDEKTTIFGRIRQLGTSIFGSRKKSINRSRIWTRLRNGSQKLKGSKRFARTKIVNKEHCNRIFLPPPNDSVTNNDKCRVYSEQYLNPPKSSNSPFKSNDNKKDDSMTQINADFENLNVRNETTRRSNELKEIKNVRSDLNRQANMKNDDRLMKSPRIVNERGDAIIKPFFITHPSKQFDLSPNEFYPSQVLSMSSDSGMEENDCQSSTENCPTSDCLQKSKMNGVKQSSKQPNNQFDYDQIRERFPVRVNHQADLKLNSRQATVPINGNGQYFEQTKLTSPYAHRQTGQWSETNLESELGYIP